MPSEWPFLLALIDGRSTDASASDGRPQGFITNSRITRNDAIYYKCYEFVDVLHPTKKPGPMW
jgi:hypothetical protein